MLICIISLNPYYDGPRPWTTFSCFWLWSKYKWQGTFGYFWSVYRSTAMLCFSESVPNFVPSSSYNISALCPAYQFNVSVPFKKEGQEKMTKITGTPLFPMHSPFEQCSQTVPLRWCFSISGMTRATLQLLPCYELTRRIMKQKLFKNLTELYVMGILYFISAI